MNPNAYYTNGTNTVSLHGKQATLVHGWHTAVEFTSWRIRQDDTGRWRLNGSVGRVDVVQSRQVPLLFTAPREKGWWLWPIDGELTIIKGQLSAWLGPPEQ